MPSRPWSTPRRFARADIAHFNVQGFVQPFDIFGADEIGRVRTCVDGLRAAMGAWDSYGINCYQARRAGLWDIATDRASSTMWRT